MVGELGRLSSETLLLILMVSMPALAVSLVVGVVIGLIQAVTQVQEQTLSFVPKLVAVAVVLAVAGGWMGQQLVDFSQELWNQLPRIAQSG